MQKTRENLRLFVFFLLGFVCLSKTYAQFNRDSLSTIETSDNFKNNISKLEAALKLKLNDENFRLDIIQALVQNYRNENQFDKATELCQSELLTARKNNNALTEAMMYQQLGKIHYYLKMPDKVLEYSKACIAIAEKNNFYELLKRSYHNLGVIELEKDKPANALPYFLISIKNGKKVPQTKKSNLARNYRLLATTYDVLKNYEAADSIFDKALNIYKHFSDSLGMVEVLTFKARMQNAQHHLPAAHRFADTAISIALIMDNDEYTQAALAVKQQLFEEENKFKEANAIMHRILEIEAHKNQKILNKELAAAETKFNIKEIENTESLKVIKANQKTQLYIFIAGILLVISLGIVSFIFQRRIAAKEKIYLKQLFETQEQERSRISKDLHDNMGAYATSLLAQIDSITASESTNPALKNLRADAENIMATLRETIWILKSGNLNLLQFKDLLRQYAEKQLSSNAGIVLHFNENLENEAVLSPATSLNLYRIFQELIQNIIKHAKASEVKIDICYSHNQLKCIVSDNGKGFDLNTQSDTSGLENMRFRAKEIAFSIMITSSKTGTTAVLEGFA